MLAWRGGSRRKIKETKQSVQGKQRHFFEQRRLLNRSDASGSVRRAEDAAASFPAKQRKGGSLDIISLTSLLIVSKASKNGDTVDGQPVGAEASGLGDSTLRLGTRSKEWSTPGGQASKVQPLEKPLEEKEGSLQKDYHGLLRGFDIFDVIDEQEDRGGARNSARQESYAAFAVQGTGEIAEGSPPSTPPANLRQSPNNKDDLGRVIWDSPLVLDQRLTGKTGSHFAAKGLDIPDFLPSRRAESNRFQEFLQGVPSKPESTEFYPALREQDSQDSPSKEFSGSEVLRGLATESLEEEEGHPFGETNLEDVLHRQSSERFSPARVAEERYADGFLPLTSPFGPQERRLDEFFSAQTVPAAGDEVDQSPPSAPPAQDKKDADVAKLDLGVSLEVDLAADFNAERTAGPEAGFEPLFPSISSPITRTVDTPGARQQEIDFFHVGPASELAFMEQGTKEGGVLSHQDCDLFPKPSSGLGKRLFADLDIDLEESAPALDSDTKRHDFRRASPKMKLDFLDTVGCEKVAEGEENVGWREAEAQPETSPVGKQSGLKRLNIPRSNFAAFEEQEVTELQQGDEIARGSSLERRGSCSASPARSPINGKEELQTIPQVEAPSLQYREPPNAFFSDFPARHETEGSEHLLFGDSEQKLRSTDEILKRLVPKRVLEEGEDVPPKRPRRTLKEATFCLDLNAAFTCETSFFETEDFGGKKGPAASLSSEPAESAAAAQHDAAKVPLPRGTGADGGPKGSGGERFEDALPDWAGACEEAAPPQAPPQHEHVEQSVEIESGAQRPKRPPSAPSAASSSQGQDLDEASLQEKPPKEREKLLCSVPTQPEAADETNLAKAKAVRADMEKDQTAEMAEAAAVIAEEDGSGGKSDRSAAKSISVLKTGTKKLGLPSRSPPFDGKPSQAEASPVRTTAEGPLGNQEKKQEDRAPCKECSPEPERAIESESGTGNKYGEGREGREEVEEEGYEDNAQARGEDGPAQKTEGARGDLGVDRGRGSSRASIEAGRGADEQECRVCSRVGKQSAAEETPREQLRERGDTSSREEEAADSGEDVTVTAAKALCLLKSEMVDEEVVQGENGFPSGGGNFEEDLVNFEDGSILQQGMDDWKIRPEP
ncbi:hypothetical protein KFL_002630020 [Klebsormidium nitens]|uniref:Uncharacterized protein n=1 Tax=Klebsormidium nitens TaxID=105231 RepID=A0A1Y1ICZ6_KLENI|nr:hypothetical protein KFL_002630020 [Klebsormidium nitens]|eukprot:GAQ85958.1 hypothetical protein KFL_002630020 [Klebsormidium nitens]